MRLAIAILCAAALAAAGCGDDEETTVVETTTVTQPDTGSVPLEEGATTPDEDEDEHEDEEPGDGTPADTPEDTNNDGAIGAPGQCGKIAFEPNTDSGAFGIEAVSVACDTARAVARAARGRSEDLSYRARGFDCSGARREGAPLPSVEWVCLRGEDQLVRFRTS